MKNAMRRIGLPILTTLELACGIQFDNANIQQTIAAKHLGVDVRSFVRVYTGSSGDDSTDVCSGSVVEIDDIEFVLTAGHCVRIGKKGRKMTVKTNDCKIDINNNTNSWKEVEKSADIVPGVSFRDIDAALIPVKSTNCPPLSLSP